MTMKQLDVKHMHPVDQINLIIGKIYKSRLTTTSGGNISIIDEQGDIWITPSAIDKGTLTTKDIMQVKKDGTIIGPHKPSSEYPFHRAIYKARPELKAIIHAHPPALVAFSIARTIPDTKIVPEIYRICGEIGYALYGTPGTEDLGKKIAHEFNDKRYKAVIMENHGVVMGGTDLLDTYERFETLEFCCRAIINAQLLGGAKYLTKEQIDCYFADKSKDSTFKDISPTVRTSTSYNERPVDETELRHKMVKFIRRGCEQGLMMTSFGTVSCRLNKNEFLITPNNIARWDIEPEDIILVKEGETTHLHQRIYELNPHVNAIICTLPANLMAHAISGKKLDVRTIPESWIYLQDLPTLPFGIEKEDIDKLALTFNKKRVVLLENESVLVTGDSLLNAFDYLEVAEFSANSLIAATSIGPLCPIGEKEIEDLRIAFNVK